MASSNWRGKTTGSAGAPPPAARRCSSLKRSHGPSPLKDWTRLLPLRRQRGDHRDTREHADELGLPRHAYFSQDGTELGPCRRDPHAGTGGDVIQTIAGKGGQPDPHLCGDKPKNSAKSLS